MSVDTRMASIPRVERSVGEQQQVGEGARLAQNCFLTELPGLVFGLLTIIYLVTALWSLA
ncbi:MAG TPA: hypothetical protein VEJ86_13195 [Candidatus Binataceae bacterium]|nr:hypothetical protein [Candidatus Binataceae bacterium]